MLKEQKNESEKEREMLNQTVSYDSLKEYTYKIQKDMEASGSAIVVIKDDEIVYENYSGAHHLKEGAERIGIDSRFNVYSTRVTYIGLAIAIAIHEGYLQLDDPISDYLTELDASILEGTSIRHLLTRCTGLKVKGIEIERVFESGKGIEGKRPDLLAKILKQVTGKTVQDILVEKIFKPMNFKSTGWVSEVESSLVCDTQSDSNFPVIRLGSNTGEDRNLYVSARELALWGNLHLNRGKIQGKQLVSEEIFDLTTSVQSPFSIPDHLPKFGFFWWIKTSDVDYQYHELGSSVPEGSYQILGASGCSCTVIPQLNAVVVRMYNSLKDFDYVKDIQTFNDLAISCLVTD